MEIDNYNIEPLLVMPFKDNRWVAACAGHELRRFKRKADCRLYLFDSAKADVMDMAADLGISARALVRRWAREWRKCNETQTTQ